MTAAEPPVSISPESSAQGTAQVPAGGIGWAVISAAVVAAVAFVVAVLAVFIAGGEQAQAFFSELTPVYGIAAIIVFLLLTVLNSYRANRWYIALAGGLVAAIVGSVLSTIIIFVSKFGEFSGQAVGFAFNSLINFNFIFVITVGIAEVFLAPRLSGAISRANAVPFGGTGAVGVGSVSGLVSAGGVSTKSRNIALVRVPAANLGEGELTHIEREPIDAAKADEQWDSYCAALIASGWETMEIEAEPDLADSHFVEDMVVMFGDLAVFTSPGAESRRGELSSVERAIASIPGIRSARIQLPGTLDGGDVLKVAETVYVGSSTRTNGEGIRQLRAILAPLGYRVVGVPVSKTLHLKSAVTALPDGTIIGHKDLIDDPGVFPNFMEVPEIHGVAVLQLSHDTILMSAAAPESAKQLSRLGYRVVTVDISEFEKLEGCVTCLSVRIR